jgi:ankyrin repeat protein
MSPQIGKWNNGQALSSPESCLAAIAAGADVNDPDASPNGRPLLLATVRKNASVIKILLDNGAAPNLVSSSRFTPLEQAIRDARVDICQLLLAAGADVSKPDQFGEMPLTYAMENYNFEVCKLLAAHGAAANLHCPGVTNSTPLHRAVNRFNEVACVQLLQLGADPMYLPGRPHMGELSPFMLAASEGADELLRLMFDTGRVDPFARSPAGATAAMLATNSPSAHALVLSLQEEFLANRTERAVDAGLRCADEVTATPSSRQQPSLGML